MPIFKLKKRNNDISNAELIPASKTNLDLEQHLENWLEHSPWAIAQEPLLLIGRQTSASSDDIGTIFPDLLGIDKDGNLVVIELKKGNTPREVIAQLLEYAAWANELSDETIHDIALHYFSLQDAYKGKDLAAIFCEAFEVEELPSLNQRIRLFVAAEEITPSVAKVCRFLRQSQGLDVNCIQFRIFQTESGETLVSSEAVVGLEEVNPPKKATTQRWSGEKPVKQIVWEAVQGFTKGDKNKLFSPKDISQLILKKYPNFNKTTVGCQIISDCINHTSRHHYPGGEDRYWWKEKGKYKLYDQNTDQSNR